MFVFSWGAAVFLGPLVGDKELCWFSWEACWCFWGETCFLGASVTGVLGVVSRVDFLVAFPGVWGAVSFSVVCRDFGVVCFLEKLMGMRDNGVAWVIC